MIGEARDSLSPMFALALLALAASVGGCGGSAAVNNGTGPGSVNPPAVLATSDTPTLPDSLNTQFPMRGSALSFSGAPGAATVTPEPDVAAARTTVSATEATLRFAISGATRTATIDLTRPVTTPSGLGVPTFQVTLSDGVLTTADTNAGTLNYASFGYWAFRPNGTPTPPGTAQTYFMGRETPLGAVPTSGAATYNGTTLGYGAVSGAEVFVTGNVLLTATFTIGGGTIGGQINTINALPVNSPLPLGAVLPTRIDFVTGAISGNTFSGNTSAVSGVGGTPVGSGSYGGRFYGPAATEVAGQWSVESGTDPSAALRLIGSFGATTQ